MGYGNGRNATFEVKEKMKLEKSITKITENIIAILQESWLICVAMQLVILDTSIIFMTQEIYGVAA